MLAVARWHVRVNPVRPDPDPRRRELLPARGVCLSPGRAAAGVGRAGTAPRRRQQRCPLLGDTRGWEKIGDEPGGGGMGERREGGEEGRGLREEKGRGQPGVGVGGGRDSGDNKAEEKGQKGVRSRGELVQRGWG